METNLRDALAAVAAHPMWERDKSFTASAPKAGLVPHGWQWRDMLPLIDRSVREVGMEDADRRVILLKHPQYDARGGVSANLSAGLQILEPGEHAEPHRHTLSAVRFVLAGAGATTTVDGVRCPMEEGDLILTPAWCWHEHENPSHSRVVWFDGLDAPFGRQMDAVFFESGPVHDLPSEGVPRGDYSPQFRYPWRDALLALDVLEPAVDGSKLLRYTNPITGGAVMPTLDCYLQGLAPGCATNPLRTTSNAICVVASGEGRSWIADRQIEWSRGDIFTLPNWKWAYHQASTPSHLFVMTDRELLARTGYLREERKDDHENLPI